MTKQAFVIPRTNLISEGIIPSETNGKALYIPFQRSEDLTALLQLAEQCGSYRERGGVHDVEKDSSVQQIIMYGYVVLPDGRFMLYQRGSLSDSEVRLAGKVSLGLGGHMEPADLSLTDAFYRELDEETVLTASGREVRFTREDGTTDIAQMQQYVNVELRGVIKDERDEVGVMHLGIACRVTPFRNDVAIAVRAETGENVRSFFVTPDEYELLVQDGGVAPEGWTDIVFREEIQHAAVSI